MTNFYKGKKKAGKKTLTKLMAIKPHNLEKLLDDFFFKICRSFFKRQMIIWILLRHKYLAKAKVTIHERRFQVKGMKRIAEETYDHLNIGSFGKHKNNKDDAGEIKPDVNPNMNVLATNHIIGGNLTPANEIHKFPFYFSEDESEPIFELTKQICERLNHLFKNTTEQPAVGSLEEYFEEKAARELMDEENKGGPNPDLPDGRPTAAEEEKKRNASNAQSPVKMFTPTPKINHYNEYGLTKDKTNIITRIAEEVGYTMPTVKNKKSVTSPKGGGKGAAAKSLKKKKTIIHNTAID